MKVVKPITITTANWYAYQDVLFDDYNPWNAVTAYVSGDKVIVAAEKSQYQCIAANTNFAPILNPTKWVRIGSTQAWRPFDGYLSSAQSTQISIGGSFDATGLSFWVYPGFMFQTTEFITYILTGLGAFDTVAVLGTDCSKVRAYFYDQTGVKRKDVKIRALDDTQIIDAWDYCFGDLTYRRDFVFENFDGWGVSNLSQLYIEISNEGAIPPSVSVGEIVVGKSQDIGGCHADATIQLVDYSKKEIDAYGTVTIVQRAYSLNGSFELEIATVDRNRVQNLMASLRATPCVYFPTADDANAGIVIYGYVKDYNTTYATPDRAYASLEVEGMI